MAAAIPARSDLVFLGDDIRCHFTIPRTVRSAPNGRPLAGCVGDAATWRLCPSAATGTPYPIPHRNLLEIFPQFAAALFLVHAAHAAGETR